MKLLSDYLHVCDHNAPALPTDGRTTSHSNTESPTLYRARCRTATARRQTAKDPSPIVVNENHLEHALRHRGKCVVHSVVLFTFQLLWCDLFMVDFCSICTCFAKIFHNYLENMASQNSSDSKDEHLNGSLKLLIQCYRTGYGTVKMGLPKK